MKAFNRIMLVCIAIILAVFVFANIIISSPDRDDGRPYRVEINRAAVQIEDNGLENADLSEYKYITGIEKCSSDFYNTNSDYAVRNINGDLYRFNYNSNVKADNHRIIINIIIAVMSGVMLVSLLFIKYSILKPFEKMSELPYELSKGKLTVPLKESKSRFFGRFIWGIDLLREKLEDQKQHEYSMQKSKKTLLLSLSHDIKTPLSAIKLYSSALSRNLYSQPEKQREIAESINEKADEIGDYLKKIMDTAKDDFMTFNVSMGEFYLSELINEIKEYYSEKLKLVKTDFITDDCSDCMLKGDSDRCTEVLQNIIENALKYGDGQFIRVSCTEEDDCILISVKNSGCTLPDSELPHIFESFWRGSNSESVSGSGLGLYICRRLLHEMNGEIFAEAESGCITVTAVITKA